MPQTTVPAGGQVSFGPVNFTKTQGHYGWGAAWGGKGGFGSDPNNPSQVLGSCASDPNCKVITVRNDGYFLTSSGSGQYALPADGTWHTGWVSYTKTTPSGSLPHTDTASLATGSQAKYKGANVKREDVSTQGGRPIVFAGSGGGCGGYNNWGRDWKNNGFGWSVEGRCIEGFDLGQCPNNLGTVYDGKYIYEDGLVKVKCNYSSLDWSKFINAGIFNDNLGSQYLEPSSWAQAKLEYCSAESNIDKSECKNYYADSRTGASWNTVKLGFCEGDKVATNSSCLTTVNNSFKSTESRDDVNKGIASTLVRNFCTSNPTNDKCACWNATQNGYKCISDNTKSTLPGCVALKIAFGKLPHAAAVLSADTFCSSNDCVGRALQDAVFMPAARAPSQSCPNIQACIQDFNNSTITGSQIDASCTNTLKLSGTPSAPGTTPTAPRTTPTAQGTTPTAQGTTPTAPGTMPTAPGTTPAASDTLWPADTIPGLDTKPKQIGLIIFIILCCCCLLLLGIGLAG